MRIIALLLLCLFAAAACSSVTIDEDDIGLYGKVKVFKPLILPAEVSASHPRLTKALHKAIARWEMSVPVEFHIYEGFDGPKGSISVMMGNQFFNPLGMHPGVLGYYNPDAGVLFLSEWLEKDTKTFPDDSVYKTCLHELGHALGLPHFIGKFCVDEHDHLSEGGTFDMVLPTLEEARKCIMYPYSADQYQEDLTDIEILLARHFLLHDLNFTKRMSPCNYVQEEPKKVSLRPI